MLDIKYWIWITVFSERGKGQLLLLEILSTKLSLACDASVTYLSIVYTIK